MTRNQRAVAILLAAGMCVIAGTARAGTNHEQEWVQEGEFWALAAICTNRTFTKEFRRVGTETLQLKDRDGAAAGKILAEKSFRRTYEIERKGVYSQAECAEHRAALEKLNAVRSHNLVLIDALAREVRNNSK